MSKLLATASRLKGMWVLGFTVLLLLVLAGAAIGIVISVPLGLLSELFGWEEGRAEWWLAISALVWLPVGIGSMLKLPSFKNLLEVVGRDSSQYR